MTTAILQQNLRSGVCVPSGAWFGTVSWSRVNKCYKTNEKSTFMWSRNGLVVVPMWSRCGLSSVPCSKTNLWLVQPAKQIIRSVVCPVSRAPLGHRAGNARATFGQCSGNARATFPGPASANAMEVMKCKTIGGPVVDPLCSRCGLRVSHAVKPTQIKSCGYGSSTTNLPLRSAPRVPGNARASLGHRPLVPRQHM